MDAFDFVRNPRAEYRAAREREGQPSPFQTLGGLSQKGSQDAYRRAEGAINPATLSDRLPGFANGGMVPGPTGAPQLAMVHGGERVMTPGQQRQSGDRIIHQNNTFNIDGASSPMATGEEVVEALRRQLAGRSMW